MDLPKEHVEKRKRIIMEEDEIHPRWLTSLLASQFYEPCTTHNWERCIYFCPDCNGPKATFCESCYNRHKEQHLDHKGFRVFKASHYPGIKLEEIQALYDVSDIRPYSINSEQIVYIKQRPRKGDGSRNHHSLSKKCQECGRELPSGEDKYKFCSIECKLLNSKQQKSEPKKDEQTRRTKCCIPNLRRSRKGKPQRAPFY